MKVVHPFLSGFASTLLLAGLASTQLACGPEEGTAFSGKPITPDRQGEDLKRSQVFQFSSGTLETETIQIDTGFGVIRQVLSLAQKPLSEERFQQLNRNIYTEQFAQGHGGSTTVDSFPVAEAGLFDLLVLVDDSSSMSYYQDRLSKTLPSILRHISNTNWQIAVATTTSPCLVVSPSGTRILTKGQYKDDPILAEHEFRSLIQIGEGGNPVERGILMATDALNGVCNEEVQPWLRDDSTRAVLLLTDEHNCGSAINEGCPGAPYETADYFFDNAPSNVTVHGLLLLEEPPFADPNDPNDPYAACQGSGGYDDLPNPQEYLRMIQATGGLVNDICRSDYSSVLEQISLDVKDRINLQYELTYPPVANTLSVSLDGKAIENFTVRGRIITIDDSIPTDADRIEINYQHSPIARRISFPLAETPDPASLQVSIGGRVQGRSEYSYDPFTNELVFRELPADRSQIRVEYRRNQPLTNEFTLSKDFVPESVKVLVNGETASDFAVDSGNRRVSFSQPPRDNSSLSIRYEVPGDKTEIYKIKNIPVGKLDKVTAFDRRNGEPVPVDVKDGHLRFSPDQVWDRREIVAEYKLLHEGDELEFSIPLQENVFLDSLKIEAAGDDSLCKHSLRISLSSLDFRCADDSMETIEISYVYATEYQNVFSLPLTFVGPKIWRVEVNGEATEHFHAFDNTVVVLREHLPPAAEVSIEVDFQESSLVTARRQRRNSKQGE